jgi:pyruvate/2-oxoglutarate dehydrogenase complex dihydrolipoamide dehydrogenase (E3) component
MEKSTYDIIVIGSGSGGLSVALFMAKARLKTLLIEKSAIHVGGDCLNYGCVPSKALIHVSRLLQAARSAEKFGYTVAGRPDIGRVMAYVAEKQSVIRQHENPEWLRKEGVEVLLGTAAFYDDRSVQVDGEVYSARRIVLATGSRPARLDVPGIEQVLQYNNESIFRIDGLPEKMLVVGGGPVGIEMAQALHRLGSQVTIIHRGSRILPRDEAAVSAILLERLAAEGITVHLQTQVRNFPDSRQALIAPEGVAPFLHSFDALFVATGRTIPLAELQLEKAGIRMDGNKIIVNRYLQTTNKHVYTCGDCSGLLMLSHAAEQQARLLLNNFFSPFKKRLNNDAMSWVTFTDPEVASFGLSEKELREKSIPFNRQELPMAEDDRAVVDDYRYGRLILYLGKGGLFQKEKILGGAMIAPHAGEMVQELILAMTAGLSVNMLFEKIYPYPTASRVNQLIIARHKEAQLTPMVRKALRWLYRTL